jgi:cell division protein FtsB
MLDFQQKRKFRAILYHRVTLVILFILVFFAVRASWGMYQKQRESEMLKNRSLEYKNGLELRQKELDAQIERLNTESGLEAEIRSKFNVAKDRENIVVVVDDKATSTMPSVPKSFWQKIKSFFSF